MVCSILLGNDIYNDLLTSAQATNQDSEKGQDSNMKPSDFIQRLEDAKEKSFGSMDFLKTFHQLLSDTSNGIYIDSDMGNPYRKN